MFTSAAATAFSAAGTAVVSAVAAGIAIAAIVVFSAKIVAAAEEGFAFSAGKNFRRFFIKTQAGRSISALFINAVVADKIPVRNSSSAFAAYCDSVGNKIMSPSAVFTFAFMFHWQKPFQ